MIVPTADARRRHRRLACSIAIEPPHYAMGTPFLRGRREITFRAVNAYNHLRAHGHAELAERARRTVEDTWYRSRRLRTVLAERDASARVRADAAGRLSTSCNPSTSGPSKRPTQRAASRSAHGVTRSACPRPTLSGA